jgi:outer membrane protein OmpA-like peptidoglycan-associated protein
LLCFFSRVSLFSGTWFTVINQGKDKAMREKNLLKKALVTGVTFSVLGSFPLATKTYGAEDNSIRTQMNTVAEEKAEIAQEEAEIARDAAALEQRRAALAERRAAAEKKEARLTREIPTRTSRVEQELADFRAKETERGLVLTLGDVLFRSGEAELTAEAMRKLYPLVALLKENPQRSILIEGHTDSSGAESYNRDLSERRAIAVRDFLVSTGIKPERITARGYGEDNPVASNATEAGRKENRRVEVVVLRNGDRVAERVR